MGFSCAICSDSLEKIHNPDNKKANTQITIPNHVNVMTTPCGHVYHAYCIIRWMSGGLINSGTCPNCRKIITAKQCVPLFHDSYEFTLLDGSGSNLVGDPTGAEAAQNVALKQNIITLTQRCDEVKHQFDDLSQTFIGISNENSNLLHELARERIKSESYLMKYQEAKSYKTYAEQKEKQCMKLQEDLTKFSYIKVMLDGVRVDMEHDIKNFPLNMISLKALVEMKHLLQQQIETMKHTAQAEQGEKECHRREILKLESKITQLKNEKKELELVVNGGTSRKLAKSQSAKISKPTRSNTSASQTRSDVFESTILISSDSADDSQENNDAEDVGLFTGFTGVGVKSRAGASKNVTKRSAKTSKELSTDANINHISPMSTRYKVKSSIPGLSGIGMVGLTGKKIESKTAPFNFKISKASSFKTKADWKI